MMMRNELREICKVDVFRKALGIQLAGIVFIEIVVPESAVIGA